MRLCRAFSIAACRFAVCGLAVGVLPLGLNAVISGAAVAQTAWPAPPSSQPASAWPAPAAELPAAQQPAASAWPAPGASQSPPAGAWPAPGESAAPPQQSFIPPPSQGFQPSFGAQQQQEPPCFKDFEKLRGETEKKGRALQEASKKKVPPPVACRLFTELVNSEGKLVKYVTTNSKKCQIPDQVVETMTKNHAKTIEIRTRVCEVAANGPPKPRGPTLNDVLSAPVPDSTNVKTGRGTYDTLTGAPLRR